MLKSGREDCTTDRCVTVQVLPTAARSAGVLAIDQDEAVGLIEMVQL